MAEEFGHILGKFIVKHDMINTREKEYDEFMSWFKTTYPDFYERNKMHIAYPFGIEGITVNRHTLNTDDFKKLVGITNEYYRMEHKQ